MEEFLLHHCVTSDAKAAEDGDRPSLWQSSGRAESVLVQENRQANGISRVMLSAVLRLVVQSSKTTKVLLLTLVRRTVTGWSMIKALTLLCMLLLRRIRLKLHEVLKPQPSSRTSTTRPTRTPSSRRPPRRNC